VTDKELVEKLRSAFFKALLWTDEENDVGPWREEAEQLISDLETSG
jgi:hypothetical protein